MLMNEARLRDIRIYGDFECLDVEYRHCEEGSDADVSCSNCFYIRAIEGVLHERQLDPYDPDLIGVSFLDNIIVSSRDRSYWEVIKSKDDMPGLPYDMFYNGTFCRISTIEDDNIFYQASKDRDCEYYAIFKLVRQVNFSKIKVYVRNNVVEKFSHRYVKRDDRGRSIHAILVVINKYQAFPRY